MLADSTWGGPCEYEVLAWWATPFRYLIRLEDATGDRALVVQSKESFGHAGSRALGPASEEARALLMVGNSVAAGASGRVEVRHEGDSTSIMIIGHRVGRDTVPLHGRCRVGAPDTE